MGAEERSVSRNSLTMPRRQRTLQTSLLATRRSDCNRGGISRASPADRRPLGSLARQAGHLGAAEVGKAGI